MAWKQLVQPSINIQARAGMCLQYVDDAIGATDRTDTAQIAYNTAKAKGWVHANQNYPQGIWFVMFWSIDNGEYRGQGHVALAYVSSDGVLQIHDSEVHRNARQPYNSLQEFEGWFGSVGTRLTYLGWSIGCDGRQIIEEIQEENEGEEKMVISFNYKGTGYSAVDGTMIAFTEPKYWAMVTNSANKRGTHVDLGNVTEAQYNQLVKAYKFGK